MKFKKVICLILVIMCVFLTFGCKEKENEKVSNPYTASWLTEDMKEDLQSIKRVDEKGILYEMNYNTDYYSSMFTQLISQATKAISSGCSAFTTYNTNEDYMLCRNYDYRHKDASGNYTGLNVVVYTAPEGKLKSIGVCDACWLNTSAYFQGALDDGSTDLSNMVLAPYMCVDGMNEAGLSVSLLLVDLKEGETLTNQNNGKERVIHSQLLRYIIDNAHDVAEAIDIANSYDVYSTMTDMHMFVCDKKGNSAVFEWRQYNDDESQKLYVTYTNAITNFFVGFDDAANAYNTDGSLKELFSGFETTFNNYKYGYGHGYHRFNEIVATLERFIQSDDNGHGIRNSLMEESQALDVLRVISQNPGTEKTSFTQYSALYNLETLSVSFYLQRNYEKSYTFSIK